MHATLAHPPERHLHGPEGARLTALLRRARRRLALARVFLTLSLGVPAVAAALMALSWLTGRVESRMVAAGLATTVAAGLVAWLGTPHAGALAALLDRRLRLADRVGTALRVSSRADAIALLIQHDAVTHLTPARIEGALPLRVHRGTRLACAALAASAGLWLVERPARENATLNPSSSGGMAVRTPPRAGANTGARGPAPTARGNRAAGQTSPAAGTAPAPAPIARAAEGNQAARAGAAQAGAPTPMASQDRTATGPSGGAGRSGNREGAASGDAVPNRETARAGGSRDVREASARGATDAATNPGGAAGGVEYGRGLNGRATVAREVATSPPSAAAIRQGQVRAETALAHGEVPPRYRAYLRDYFRAVQAMSEP